MMMTTMSTTTTSGTSSAIMDERPTLARALYTNVPETSNELGFRKGDILTVIEIDHDGQPNWWLCTLRGQRGICPSNYLELLEDKYALPHEPSSKNLQGGSSSSNNSGGGSHGEAESTSSNSTLVDEPLQDYDVPRSCRQAAVVAVNKMPAVNPLDLYDVPRSGRYNNSNNTSTDSLSRAKNRQSELSLLSTGSSAHLSSASSSSSSSARSSASCDLNGALVSTDFHADSVSRSSGRSSNSRGTGASEDTESIMSGRSSNEDHQLYENFPVLNKEDERFYHPPHHHRHHHHRSSIQSENNSGGGPMVSGTTGASDLYDVPRSEPTSRAQSAMSMSSGLGLSIANSDSKDSLDLYDVPRNGGSVQAYVNHIEAKYDHLHGSRTNCCGVVRKLSEHRDSVDSQSSVDPQDLYDVPRSSNQAPSVVPRYPSKLSASMASMSISEDNSHPSTTNLHRSHSKSVDLRRRGFVQLAAGVNSAKAISCQQLNQPSANNAGSNMISKNDERLAQSSVSLHSQRLTAGSNSFTSSTSTITSHSTVEDVKILPLNPRAAVTVCEKLRQEVITSIKSILDFVKPKWRTKDNLTDIMPDLRFSCIRLNLAVKDMVDFCSRSLSNGKKFSIEAHVIKLQRLLTPLINGSQIIQRDIDELEAYFWSAERLSRPAGGGGDGKQNSKNSVTPSDALDQLVLCAKSLQHDVTEIANFLALNSTALFRETERLNAAASTTTLTSTGSSSVVKDGGSVSGGEEEDYDYVRLVDCESNGQKEGEGEEESNGIQLLPCDQQLLEFYTAQIASIAPLLSQSISTFISSIQQNDPPKTFNGHLKYVILLAYKMLFAGDTIHRNIANPEIREEVEKKANDLHKSVVSLHEASRTAARDFPRIPPMQAIVDRVWETTAAATQLKKAIFHAATF